MNQQQAGRCRSISGTIAGWVLESQGAMMRVHATMREIWRQCGRVYNLQNMCAYAHACVHVQMQLHLDDAVSGAGRVLLSEVDALFQQQRLNHWVISLRIKQQQQRQ